jgi:hypothetical protein
MGVQRETLSYLIDAGHLGGVKVDAGTPYERLLHQFGPLKRPYDSATYPVGLCRLAFGRSGLMVGFRGLYARKPGTPSTCTFLFATATGTAWHTTKGLKVGASTRAIRHLYPNAFNAGRTSGRHWGIPFGSNTWSLTTASGAAAKPILVAYAKSGRVVALGIDIAGH